MAHTTREAPRWASPQTKTPGAEVCQSEPQAMAPRRFRVTPRSSRSGVCSTPSKPMARRTIDRKSTRLNSSHSQISYAVFCLKKKKKNLSQSVALDIAIRQSFRIALNCCHYFSLVMFLMVTRSALRDIRTNERHTWYVSEASV